MPGGNPGQFTTHNFQEMNSYREVSKEVGYIGYVPYPTQNEAAQLLERLRRSPQMEDFKKVLSYYRFAPAAENTEELKVIDTIERAMTVGRNQLFDDSPYEEEPASFREVVSSLWVLNRFRNLSLKQLLTK